MRSRTIPEIKDDPDNRFLECAAAGRADYLVTGNQPWDRDERS